MPFQDTDAALKEIEYACDTLKVDGFALQSNYAGIYISDDRFDLILEELNRCSAVVLLHPGTPGGDNLPLFGRHMSVYEFPFETTRAVMDLIYKGKLQRYPKIRWIIAHAGGTIPYLADRLSIAKEWGSYQSITRSCFGRSAIPIFRIGAFSVALCISLFKAACRGLTYSFRHGLSHAF